MDATVARETAKQVNLSETNSQYSEVKAEIKEAAYKGEFKTYYYDSLKSGVKERLEEEGYKLQYSSYRNETTTTISW